MFGLAAIPVLETDRLVLRGWRIDDVAPMTSINADPEVAPWLGSPDPSTTRDRIEAWIDHWRRRGFGPWAVEERSSGEFIGRVGLLHHDDWTASPHDAEIGWALARSAWGRGYATEAAQSVMAGARARPDLKKIISITRPDNIRSRRVMEKLCLTYRGATTWRGFDQVWYSTELNA